MVKNSSVAFLFLWGVSAIARLAAHTVSAVEINRRQVGLRMLKLGKHPLHPFKAYGSSPSSRFCITLAALRTQSHEDGAYLDPHESRIYFLECVCVCVVCTVLWIHTCDLKSHFPCTPKSGKSLSQINLWSLECPWTLQRSRGRLYWREESELHR